MTVGYVAQAGLEKIQVVLDFGGNGRARQRIHPGGCHFKRQRYFLDKLADADNLFPLASSEKSSAHSLGALHKKAH